MTTAWPEGDYHPTKGEMGDIRRRLDRLEKEVFLTRHQDQSRVWYHRDEFEAAPPAMAQAAPWVSTTTRFAESLTSTGFVKATAGQAVLLAITFGGLASVAALWWELPWTLVPISVGTGFALSAGVLTVMNRGLLHRLVKGQAERNDRRRQELRVQIDKRGSQGKVTGIEYLYVGGLTREALVAFAPVALRSNSLSVNVHGGGGKLLTQGQAAALFAELEALGYASPAKGPFGRQLTAKGKALFRGLAELKIK